MNPYIFPTNCSVCGGEGMMHAKDIGSAWLASFRHADPEVCAGILRSERTKIENEKKKLAEMKAGAS